MAFLYRDTDLSQFEKDRPIASGVQWAVFLNNAERYSKDIMIYISATDSVGSIFVCFLFNDYFPTLCCDNVIDASCGI